MSEEKEYEVSDHQLSISSITLLWRLFRHNKVDKQYKWKVRQIWIWAIVTQPFQWLQKLIVWPQLRLVDFFKEPPTFVIGHWRSGTTHLHYLISRDKQFGFLTNYQSIFMRMSFVGKGIMDRVLDHFMPETRPQDNVKMTAYEPAEEEQPFTTLTEFSGMQSWFFPKNQTYFDKFNLFKGTTKREKRIWKRKYHYMLKLISLANKNKPLLLKNPHNTSRVKELLEIFPNAKFVFIHRHPFDVYHSMHRLYNRMLRSQLLQEMSEEQQEERILYYYRETLKKYLEDRHLIPKERLIEISFDELEQDAMGTIEKVYNHLGIPGLDVARADMNEYLSSVKNYQKNVYHETSPALAEKLIREWAFAFEEWDYVRVPQTE